jgi:hypothetical protein
MPLTDRLDRGFVADREVAPRLWSLRQASHFRLSSRIVEAHEPLRLQTFRSEFAVERLDEGVISGLARLGEVERDAALISPEVEIA